MEKTGKKRPWKSKNDFHFSHSFNNNKLDDRDHFLENATASVASLRGLITSIPERRSRSVRDPDHLHRNTQNAPRPTFAQAQRRAGRILLRAQLRPLRQSYPRFQQRERLNPRLGLQQASQARQLRRSRLFHPRLRSLRLLQGLRPLGQQTLGSGRLRLQPRPAAQL